MTALRVAPKGVALGRTLTLPSTTGIGTNESDGRQPGVRDDTRDSPAQEEQWSHNAGKRQGADRDRGTARPVFSVVAPIYNEEQTLLTEQRVDVLAQQRGAHGGQRRGQRGQEGVERARVEAFQLRQDK